MSHRQIVWTIGAAGVVCVAVFAALVLGPAWALLPPGLFLLTLFFTAEDNADDATPRR